LGTRFRCHTPGAAGTIEQYYLERLFISGPGVRESVRLLNLVGEFTGPGGVHLGSVPGVSTTGTGVWKIRFSPTSLGTWSLRTRSPCRRLNGRAETGIECQPKQTRDGDATAVFGRGPAASPPLHPSRTDRAIFPVRDTKAGFYLWAGGNERSGSAG